MVCTCILFFYTKMYKKGNFVIKSGGSIKYQIEKVLVHIETIFKKIYKYIIRT